MYKKIKINIQTFIPGHSNFGRLNFNSDLRNVHKMKFPLSGKDTYSVYLSTLFVPGRVRWVRGRVEGVRGRGEGHSAPRS